MRLCYEAGSRDSDDVVEENHGGRAKAGVDVVIALLEPFEHCRSAVFARSGGEVGNVDEVLRPDFLRQGPLERAFPAHGALCGRHRGVDVLLELAVLRAVVHCDELLVQLLEALRLHGYGEHRLADVRAEDGSVPRVREESSATRLGLGRDRGIAGAELRDEANDDTPEHLAVIVVGFAGVPADLLEGGHHELAREFAELRMDVGTEAALNHPIQAAEDGAELGPNLVVVLILEAVE
mmetsp:Transcript_88145/g.247957  ORF Transcript_88145/g.247957 Transcript_88145/m.247957 type:complete len:237 (-) Transcript_88145:1861-2571(-)